MAGPGSKVGTDTDSEVCVFRSMLKSKYFQNFVEYLNYLEVRLANSQFVKEESPYTFISNLEGFLLFFWMRSKRNEEPAVCSLLCLSLCGYFSVQSSCLLVLDLLHSYEENRVWQQKDGLPQRSTSWSPQPLPVSVSVARESRWPNSWH